LESGATTDVGAHGHVLDTYFAAPPPHKHSMAHAIHALRFGPQLPDALAARWKWTDALHANPLDGTAQHTADERFNFEYFIKVVSTSYLPLGGVGAADGPAAADAPLGQHGLPGGGGGGSDGGEYTGGPIETHQYSVTSHKRSVDGGDDAAEGHRERMHARGGMPGVFFYYDISPMKVVNREVRPKPLAGLLTGVCAVIGGSLTVAATVDRLLYEGADRVRKLHRS
ncbi:hypothetical protein KEM52_001469, partial [Ascosphaera acerosa]